MQQRRNATGAASTAGTTVIPRDDTIPQITEGAELLTQAITCRATMNLVRVDALMQIAPNDGASYIAAALFKDATASALAVTSLEAPNGAISSLPLRYVALASTVSAATFRIRAGKDAGAAGVVDLTLNGVNGARFYGGVLNSYLEIEEIVA